jgi:predicted tellurium resistance membrane protein TerC
MISAVLLSTLVMMFTSGFISRFVEKHPTLKILALSFLLMIGFTLMVEGFGQHVSKFAIYFAMGFSVLVESLNIRFRSKSIVRESEPVQLRERIRED